jgi:hypothetical protein
LKKDLRITDKRIRCRFNDRNFIEKSASLKDPLLKSQYFFIILNEKLTVSLIVEPTSKEYLLKSSTEQKVTENTDD